MNKANMIDQDDYKGRHGKEVKFTERMVKRPKKS
ncbi:protein of unknown function [Maridesulfovibrio hydrothermalis AM13 = DSM 14728]|uniref:Uncharacterized protein n=1 Tax=Maridesulfovibrio hydrothermalis AM13 = DSM 14728 TaxID=1121451 RepID=L0R8G1_9BACT|nr:protein of unknown function [Maridesulfovibrio hydrothermalis AM13 = DSM 14728]